MHDRSVPHQGVKEGAAGGAARVVVRLAAENRQALFALGDRQLLPLDAGEGLEGRAGHAPAIRAVAVGRVLERVGDHILDGAALTASGKRARVGPFGVAHQVLLSRPAVAPWWFVRRIGRFAAPLPMRACELSQLVHAPYALPRRTLPVARPDGRFGKPLLCGRYGI